MYVKNANQSIFLISLPSAQMHSNSLQYLACVSFTTFDFRSLMHTNILPKGTPTGSALH